jgi:predicted heme/steroid binding protein
VRHIKLAAMALCAVDALLGSFTSGTLFWANQVNFNIHDVSVGGDLSMAPIAAFGKDNQAGQIAFARDLQTAYFTGLNRQISRIRPGSQTREVFLSLSFTPKGIVVTPTGEIYVSGNGKVYEVSTGKAKEFASGLSGVRNLLWTPAGILAVEQYTGHVKNLGSGGNLTYAPPFATGIPDAKDIESFGGRIYVSGADGVYDITAGGAAVRWASGQNFLALASTPAALYAVNAEARPRIFNVTAGGKFTSSDAWGFNLPANGDSMFDAVPYLPQAATSIPEPGTWSVAIGAALFFLGRKRL